MLETTANLEAHKESPGKKPELRLKTIEEAGKLKVPFTTGLLIGIGETWKDRIDSLCAVLNTFFKKKVPILETGIMQILEIA